MADDDDRRTPDDTSGERLAAYLAGDLDEVRTRAVERELERDPARREELERIHEAVLRLRRVDEVAVPDGLAGRVRARVREEEEQTRASRPPAGAARRTAPIPWWRRPIAAVAALGLLAVVAISTVVGVGGGGEATREVFSADGGAEAADDAGAAGAAGAEAAGPSEVAAAAVPEAALPPQAGAELRRDGFAAATAAQSVLLDAGDLSDPAARATFLRQLRDDPEVAAVLGGGSRPPEWVAEARTALQAEGVAEDCVRTLLTDAERRPVLVLRADVEGQGTVGVVSATGDALQLLLVDPAASCTVVVEQDA